MRIIAMLLLVALPASAQDLASRVASVGTGTVRFSYAAKEGVCGNGRGSIQIRSRDGATSVGERSVNTTRRNEWEDDCEPGPVRVAVDVESRRVVALRSYVGGRWRGESARDLGEVPAAEASAFLLELTETATSRVARDAIFPAIIANVPSPSRRLLTIAKDEDRPREVRTQAIFWVAQAAGEVVTADLEEFTNDPEKEVRESAVFSLSQRPADESVPALIRLARTHRDPNVRRTAVFWLGQKRDPRALAYFEEVLLGRK